MLTVRCDGVVGAARLAFQALTAQVEALSRQKPVLMILEDAHWADPTSIEAFSRAVDRTKAFGVLLIVTYRPEFEPLWTGRPNVTVLTLNRLREREIAAMIDGVTGNKRMPESDGHFRCHRFPAQAQEQLFGGSGFPA
jgi:predicted ATPase